MKIVKAVIGLGLLVLFLIFAMQNGSSVTFQLFSLRADNIPLFVVIIACFVSGFIVGRISGWFGYLFAERKIQKKEKK